MNFNYCHDFCHQSESEWYLKVVFVDERGKISNSFLLKIFFFKFGKGYSLYVVFRASVYGKDGRLVGCLRIKAANRRSTLGMVCEADFFVRHKCLLNSCIYNATSVACCRSIHCAYIDLGCRSLRNVHCQCSSHSYA